MTMPTNECERAVREFQVRQGWDGTVAVTITKASLRTALIFEEAYETVKAMRDGDLVETADGLADLLYVTVGTAISCGERCPDTFVEPTDLASHSEDLSLAFQADVAYWLSIVSQAIRDAAYTQSPNTSYRLGIAIRGLSVFVCETAAVCGIPLKAVFNEVHRSNMSKNPGRPAGDGAKYGTGGGKGPDYRPPDIAGILGLKHEKPSEPPTKGDPEGEENEDAVSTVRR